MLQEMKAELADRVRELHLAGLQAASLLAPGAVAAIGEALLWAPVWVGAEWREWAHRECGLDYRTIDTCVAHARAAVHLRAAARELRRAYEPEWETAQAKLGVDIAKYLVELLKTPQGLGLPRIKARGL
jgi:hypothetical protein